MLVGIDGSPEALVAARHALGRAERRHLDVVLVYSYPLPVVDLPASGAVLDILSEAGRSVVEDAVAALEVPPTVTVSTEVLELVPAVLLERMSGSAALMVVG